MRRPTRAQRAALDSFILELAKLGGGLTLEDFRECVIQQIARSEKIVRTTLYGFGLGFMTVLISIVAFAEVFRNGFGWIVAWAVCLGGLGAVASLLLHVLKLVPQEMAQRPEELDALARIFLGCIFSLVLSLALVSGPLQEFQRLLSGQEEAVIAQTAPKTGVRATGANVQILLPFLCGYSIPLVLGLLDKAAQAISITFGLNERRAPTRGRRSGV